MARTYRIYTQFSGVSPRKVRDGQTFGPTSDFKKGKKRSRRAKERRAVKQINAGNYDLTFPKFRKTDLWDWY